MLFLSLSSPSLALFTDCRSTVHFYFHGIILYFDRVVLFMLGFVGTVFHQVFGSLGLTEIKCYLFRPFRFTICANFCAHKSDRRSQREGELDINLHHLLSGTDIKYEIYTPSSRVGATFSNLLNIFLSLLFISRLLFGCFRFSVYFLWAA